MVLKRIPAENSKCVSQCPQLTRVFRFFLSSFQLLLLTVKFGVFLFDCFVFLFFFIQNTRCFIALTETSHTSRKQSAVGQVLQGRDSESLRLTCMRFIGDCSCEQLRNMIAAMKQLQLWSQTTLQEAFHLGWPFRIFMFGGKKSGFYLLCLPVIECRPPLGWG